VGQFNANFDQLVALGCNPSGIPCVYRVRTIVGGGGTLLQENPVKQLFRAIRFSAAAPNSGCCHEPLLVVLSVDQAKKKARWSNQRAFFRDLRIVARLPRPSTCRACGATDYLIFDSL
jgi:hypothetical protein